MNTISISRGKSAGTINKNIYGHFSEHLGRCIYNGFFVGKDSPIPNVNGMRTDVVDAMKAIGVPVLRWPGGCFADEYHWRDGIGPQEQRKRMVNTNWGYVVEDNSFGTHEFLELCEQLDCDPYINANVGSGTVQEMAEWVEYLNSEGDSTVVQQRWANGRKAPWGVKYWGVGNESWGCGGNMTPEYYANEYRRYQTYCRNYGEEKLFRIACGPNTDDYEWTEVLMKNAGKFMDGLTLHYYTTSGSRWEEKGLALEFTVGEYYHMLKNAWRMDELVSGHKAIMDRYDPEHKVGLIVDEWGSWHLVEPGTNPAFLYQQNTMRDAMVAAITLNVFNRNCDRVIMANLAQTVNVLQSVILTEGDQMVLTPTYHVFDLYKNHHDAREVGCMVECDEIGEEGWKVPQITASASEKDGKVTVTAANVSMDAMAEVKLRVEEGMKVVSARVLAGKPEQYNDFGNSPLSIQPLEIGAQENGCVCVNLPACCVAEIVLA